MIRLLLVFLGALMSIHAFGANTTFLCLPHWASHPSRLTTTEPTASPVTVDEIGLSTEVIPYSGMVTGSSQLEGARPVASGAPDDWQMALTAVVKQAGKTGVGTWTYSDGTDDYGQIPPWVLTGIVTGPCVTGGAGYQQPQGHTLPDGRIIVVYEDWLANTTSSVTLDPQTEEFSAPSVVRTHDTAFTVDVHPSPAIWSYGSNTASGVLLMAASMYVDGSGTSIAIDYSTDAGANWLPLGVSNLTLATGSYDYDKMSVAYDPCSRQLTMCIRKVDGGTTTIETYVSDENGQTWTHLTNAGIEATDYSMVSYNGAIVRVWIERSDQSINCDVLGQNMTSWVILKDNLANFAVNEALNGHLALVRTESDTLAVYYRDNDVPATGYMTMSSDGGRQWGVGTKPYTSGTSYIWIADQDAGSAALTEGLNLQSGTASGGKVFVFGGYTTAGGTDNSLVGLTLGGISSMTPTLNGSADDFNAYYPVSTPANKSSQFTFTGASTQDMGYTLGANSRQYYRINSELHEGYVTHASGGGGVQFGRSALWVVDASTSYGGDLNSAAQLIVRASSGANDYQMSVSLDFANTQLRAFNKSTALTTYQYNATVLEVFINLDASAGLGSAWFRDRSSAVWTCIADQVVLTSGATAGQTVLFGKMSSTATQIDTLLFRVDFAQNLAARVNPANEINGIESTPQPLILPQGPGIQWTGSPLRPGNTWAINAVSSQPISRTSPWSVAANPSLIWQGSAGSAGATYIQQVADTGIATPRVLTDQLGYIGWSNAPGIESVELIGWDGAAWDSLIDASTVLDGFDGVVGISYEDGQLYPYSYTGTSREYEEDELAGHWAYWTDGTHEMAGLITHNTVGRWSSSSSAIGMGITIDEDSRVVIAGADEAFTDSTGVLRIYSPQGIGIQYLGGSPITQYAGVRITMAPGATVPSGGLYAWGPAVPFSRQERDGSSWEYAGTDEIVQAGMTTRARRISRINRRTIELPFEQILSHEGEVVTSATTPNYQSWNGSTPRARVDNNIAALRGALRTIGQRALIGVAMAVEVATDPTSPLVVLGQRVMFGRSSAGLTVTAGRGQVHAPGSGHQRGTSITITEEG